MFKGKQYYNKSEILVYLTQLLILEKICEPNVITLKFNISKRTLASYIRTIKYTLSDMMIYHITISYDKRRNIYVCNTKY
jgi:hypothetical protein